MDLKKTAQVIAAAAAVNLGLAAYMGFDVIQKYGFGYQKLIIGVVAIAGIYALYTAFSK